MQRFYRPSLHDLFRDLALALLIGTGIGVIIWMGDSQPDNWWIMPAAAWLGLWVYGVATATLTLFSRVLARLAGGRLYALLTVLLFSASAVAFYLGVQSLPLLNPLFLWVAGESPPWLFIMFATPNWGTMLSFAGALGVIVGLMFFRYELMKSRLEESMETLKEREHAERELETARKLQQRILGPTHLRGDGYEIAARNRPALYVAGDFYDVSPRTDGDLGLVTADVSGKGMAASLVMASVKGRLPLLAESFGVAETLTELNRSLVDELGRREFVALCYVRYSPATGEIELANAGLPDPYALAEGESPRALSAPGPRLPLGAARNIVYETVTARIEPGERLFLFTDGLPEALLPDGSPLGYPGFEKMLGWRDRPLESWLEALFGELESTVGSHRDDDWTALLLERSAEPVMGLED